MDSGRLEDAAIVQLEITVAGAGLVVVRRTEVGG